MGVEGGGGEGGGGGGEEEEVAVVSLLEIYIRKGREFMTLRFLLKSS